MDFKHHAQERTAIEYLQRCIKDTLHAEAAPKKTLICDELPRAESVVSQDVLLHVYAKLAMWEEDARTQMGQFQHMRTVLPAYLTADPVTEKATTDDNAAQQGPQAKLTPRKVRKPRA